MQTQETIKQLLETSNKAVERALVVLYERQTSDEQSIGTTKHVNGVGFSGADAQILSSFAEQIIKKLGQPNAYLKRDNQYGDCLSPKQMAIARPKVMRYSRQLLEAAEIKANAPAVVTLPAKEYHPVGKGKTAILIQEEKALLSFWLRSPHLPWQEITEEQAKAWYDRMYKMAVFYRQEDTIRAWEKKAPGLFWINHAGDMLQVMGQGQAPDMEERAKAVAVKVKALAAEGRHEEAGRAVVTFFDGDVKAFEKEFDKAFDAWRDSVETLDEPEEIKAEREDAMRPEEPYSKFASIKAGIKAWAAE